MRVFSLAELDVDSNHKSYQQCEFELLFFLFFRNWDRLWINPWLRSLCALCGPPVPQRPYPCKLPSLLVLVFFCLPSFKPPSLKICWRKWMKHSLSPLFPLTSRSLKPTSTTSLTPVHLVPPCPRWLLSSHSPLTGIISFKENHFRLLFHLKPYANLHTNTVHTDNCLVHRKVLKL